ncbi:hypothetical protein Tco_0887964 [Tanacetum coccineum]
MANLKFADTHNMVAFLSKPAESEGFEQIVDFLNANPIKYALTINPTIYISCIEQFWSTVKAKTVNGEVQLHALVDGKKIIITESIVRRDLQLEDAEGVDCLPNATISEQLTLMGYEKISGKQKPKKPKRKDTRIPQFSGPTEHVANEAVYKELDHSLVRAATTASSLEAEQDSGNIIKTQSKATPNESSSLETTSGGGPRCQETIGDAIAQTRFKNVSKLFNDPLLEETTQANEIASLKRRVKRLEKKKRSRTHGLKRLYKVGLSARVEFSRDEESLDNADMFDVNTLTGDEVLAEQEVAAKDVNLTVDITTQPSVPVSIVTASTKDSAATTTTATIPTPRKGIVFQEPGKGKIVKPDKPMKKKELIRLNEEIALKLQAEFDEEVRLAREKAEKEQEANVALTEEWDNVQAKIDQRRKHFAAKRAEEKRNRPPTRAQQRSIMCTYLKNIEGWQPKSLKNKSFANIQELFDKAMKRVNTFVDYRTELVEGSSKKTDAEIAQESSSKRAGDELEQESIKKQKVDEDKETTELKSLMEVIPDEEEVAVDAIPLATKPPSIVE